MMSSYNRIKTMLAHVILIIVFGFLFFLSLQHFSKDSSNWFPPALMGISTFFLALVWMNYMGHLVKARKKSKFSIDENFLKELPLSDRIALYNAEPVEVLDRHEIRRSLVIALTVVYIALLFKGDTDSLKYFTWVYLAIIAFYFGSRILEKYGGIAKAAKEASQQMDDGPVKVPAKSTVSKGTPIRFKKGDRKTVEERKSRK